VAVLVPFATYRNQPKRKLGLYKGKATVVIKDDFKMTVEEFLDS
jgi:hypothetical protein